MKLSQIALAGVAAALFAFGAAPAKAALNLIQNPGFETGSTSSWTTNGWGALVNAGGISADSGRYFAGTACTSPGCFLEQVIATSSSDTYALTFNYNPGQNVSQSGAGLKVFFGGTLVDNIGPGPLGWETVTLTGLRVTGSSNTLEFLGFQNPETDGLDNVSLVVTGIPEPATWAMMLIGMGGIGFAVRRRGKLEARAAA